ncbi:MAG: ACT domain-containing protein [Oscillospiraceae bacterium]|jgi:chorismate mutase
MGKNPKFYLVDADVLPEVFLKVAEAKRSLETGEARTVNEAAARAGVSRSAFYKYRDAVTPFYDMFAGRIISFQMTLRDEIGVLSSILGIFADFGANILTINSSIPVNGCAAVTITAETTGMRGPLPGLVERASSAPGVVKFEIAAG